MTKPNVKIQFNGILFPAHRNVLSQEFGYFAEIFSSKRPILEVVHINSEFVDPSVFMSVFNFAYTYEMPYTIDNCELLLLAAAYLFSETLVNVGQEFVSNHLTIDNCLYYENFSNYHHFLMLKKNCHHFITNNFKDLLENHMKTVNFNSDSFQDFLKRFFFDENILNKTIRHEIVFHSILSWIVQDTEQRLSYFVALTKHFDYSVLSPEFLILNEKIIKSVFEMSDFQFPFQRSLQCSSIIVAFPYLLKDDSFKKYYLSSNRWYSDCTFQSIKSNFADKNYSIALFDDKIYMIGGEKDGKVMGKLINFDFKTFEWNLRLSNMPTARSLCGTVIHDNRLYVCGGNIDGKTVRTVERYNPKKNKWIEVKEMKSRRQNLQVISYNGYIYAIGGEGGSGADLKTVECYCSRENQWKQVSPMLNARSKFCSTIFNKKILVSGNSSFETYNPANDTWSQPDDIPFILVRMLFNDNNHLRAITFDGRYLQYDSQAKDWFFLAQFKDDKYFEPNSIFISLKI